MAVTPQSEEPKQIRRAKDSYEVTVHQLIHNNVNTSVHKALYAHLAEDKSLYTSTSSTLFLSLSRLGANSLSFGFGMEPDALEDVAPFEVESKLCELDRDDSAWTAFLTCEHSSGPVHV